MSPEESSQSMQNGHHGFLVMSGSMEAGQIREAPFADRTYAIPVFCGGYSNEEG